MMKTPNRKLLSFILISVVVLIVAYSIGSKIAHLQNDGAFDRWEDFSAPVPAEKIVGATSNMLWIQTLDGSIYQGNPYCQQNSDCLKQWQEAVSDPSDSPRTDELPLERNQNCRFGDFPAMPKMPQEPIECVRAGARGPYYSSIIYYAILEDGTIIMLKHRRSVK